MSDSTEKALTLATLVGASVAKAVVLSMLQHVNKSKFEKVGVVSELYLWPVKSFGGLKIDSARCTKTGLFYKGAGDRHWAVSLQDGTWQTQRELPRMALISVTIDGGQMVFNAPEMKPLKIPLDPEIKQYEKSKIKVKLDWADSLDLGDTASEWVSTFLERDNLRMHFSPQAFAKRDAVNAVKLWDHDAKKGDLLAFSDYCGYMLMTNKSMEDLNKRLAKPVTILNFRPNIIVNGCPAYDEDDWEEVRIGKAKFRQIDACTRCILTTVDPFTGEKAKNGEPLKTLKSYRLKPKYGKEKPCLGIHLALDTKPEEEISIGDIVYAKRRKN